MSRDSDDCCFDGYAQVTFSRQLQFSEHHSTNFLGPQFLLLSPPIHHNLRLSVGTSFHNTERKSLGLLGRDGIAKTTSDDTFHVIHGIAWIGRHLTLSRHTDKFSFGSEGHP
mmetsp:Transcript_6386/g.11670  ORF Transcript_6386/g.11670 Transcript_6386/m.11670 type:complete len:112 (-) Transcript_6386:228-563(-)